jgi:hypothetical protein
MVGFRSGLRLPSLKALRPYVIPAPSAFALFPRIHATRDLQGIFRNAILFVVAVVILIIGVSLTFLYIARMDPTQDFNFFSKSFAADSSLSFVSGLNPTPSFPTYSGPYPVGTLDVEVPTSEVLSPSPAPDPTITTVSFRVFYPCNPPKEGPKSVYWLPDPQRQYIKAYAQFLGASSSLSGFVQ